MPVYYRVAADLLTQADRLVVLGPDSSGEVEPVIVSLATGCGFSMGSGEGKRVEEGRSGCAFKPRSSS